MVKPTKYENCRNAMVFRNVTPLGLECDLRKMTCPWRISNYAEVEGLLALLKSGMRDLIILFVHVIATVVRVLRPGGVRAVIAESVLAKHQLLILNRSRRRAPNLRTLDRLIAGFCSLWIRPTRLRRVAIAFRPSTFLNFHRAMVKRKYRLLFSPSQRTKPAPRVPLRT